MSEPEPLSSSPPAANTAAGRANAASKAGATPPPTDDQPTPAQKAYWRANITFVAVLLLIWFTVSCVCGVLLVDQLNDFHIGGFPLGFWFSQQGSVITFIFLILIYAIGMGMLDRKYGFDTDLPDAPVSPPTASAPPTAPPPSGTGSDEGAA